jgi:FtsZ-binding cell division protein ZapB
VILKEMNYGFISQEVEQVIPEMVTQVSETFGETTIEDFRVLNTDALVSLLVKAVQELQAENEELKSFHNGQDASVQSLEDENEAIRKEMKAIKALLNDIGAVKE